MSLKLSVLAPRAFLLFTPFLLILIAAGLAALRSMRVVQALALAVVGAITLAGCVYGFDRPHSPRDYKRIAAILAVSARPEDAIMIRSHNWADSPLSYYIHRPYITEQQLPQLAPNYPSRVWMVPWRGDPRPAGFRNLAEAGYIRTENFPVLGGELTLYERKSSARSEVVSTKRQ
jgi:hypothetical protein